MAPKVMLVLGTFALFVSSVESVMSECNSDNRDCSCSDRSYKECQEPNTGDNFHVNTLEECIFQCDLFASFDACTWLRYDQSNSEDENCHLYGPGKEAMLDYVGSCNRRGKPMRDTDNKCYIDPSDDPKHFCDIAQICPGSPGSSSPAERCRNCDNDFPCGMIYETECSMETSGTDDSGSANTEAGCNLFCTGLGVGDLVTYMQYGVREEECTCYFSGKRKCDNVIMAQGITFADYEKCGGSNPDVPTPPPVECTSDNDCNDPSKPLCDLPTNVCKAGCKKHENCADIEYCDCDEGSECPGGGVGSCLPGCRDLGSSCTMATGASGECQEHVCTPSGKPKIKKITATTLDCAGCDPTNEGATMTFDVVNTFPTDTCTTPKLDNAATTDFEVGQSAVFEGDSLGPNDGGCKLYEAFTIKSVVISWSGSGKWKPNVVTVDHELTTCCTNVQEGTASSAQPLTLTCGDYLC